MASVLTMYGQSWRPLTNENGDTLKSDIALFDTTYVKNEVVFFFKDQSLNRDALCASFEWTNPLLDKGKGSEVVQSSGVMAKSLRVHVMSEQLSLASVVNDPSLISYLQSVGGMYFTRINAASPCSEQKSITRRGDTIPSLDHCYYLLRLNNDTSVQQVALVTTLAYGSSVYYAQPNFLYNSHRIPGDPRYTDQKGLNPPFMNVQRLWDMWTGLSSTLVAVIDDGISYTHCEFGPNGEGNLGDKVVDGFNYIRYNETMASLSSHGTPVASIIGAYTNRATCGVDMPAGIAGIAGGWGPQNGRDDEGGGAKLLGLKVGDNGNVKSNTARTIGAIREAAGDKTTPFSKYHNAWAADLIMLSHTTKNEDVALEDAVMYARNHDVPIVVPTSNSGDQTLTYPNAYGDWRCVSVGASNRFLNRIGYSNYQSELDVIAPGGEGTGETNLNVGASGSIVPPNQWTNFSGTSASAPNVAGVIAAIHNNLLVESGTTATFLAQEDYEGLLAATAKDRTADSDPIQLPEQSTYLLGYDSKTGWGHVDAGKIVDNKAAGYVLRHYDTQEPLNTVYGAWSTRSMWQIRSLENRVNTDIPTGSYSVEYRKVSVAIAMPSGWDRSQNLYVWARGGQRDNGYDLANPNYAQGFTRGQADQGLGNNLTEPILLPESKNVISLYTFQLKLYNLNGQFVGVYPPDGAIRYSYTIYGVRSATGVNDSRGNSDLYISPNPSVAAHVGLNGISIVPGAQIRVVSSMGTILVSRTVQDSEQGYLALGTGTWPAGVYYVSVVHNNTITSSSFVITR